MTTTIDIIARSGASLAFPRRECGDAYTARPRESMEFLRGCTTPVAGLGMWCEKHRLEMDALNAALRAGTVKAEPITSTRRAGTPEPMDPDVARRIGEARRFLDEYTGRDSFMLDLRADRRYGTKWFRVTEKMADVILRVRDREAAVVEAAADDPAVAWVMANREANDFARSLAEALTRWGRLTDNQRAAVMRNVARDADRPQRPSDAPAATEGWYLVDGTVYKVQKAVHGSGRLYAKRLAIAGESATWEYAPGMVNRLTDADRMTVEQAAEMGTLYGICMVCGATLTDEASIARGIGPVCMTRL